MKKLILIIAIVAMSSAKPIDYGASLNLEAQAQASENSEEYALSIRIDAERDLFNKAVEIIKKYETIHNPEHYPYIGYGHMLLPEDNLHLPITEHQADSILRVDLLKKMAHFDCDYKNKLLLGVLSYNIGQFKIINFDGTPKSKIATILLSKHPDISRAKAEYSSWRMWNGKVIKSIERRRIEEFELIYPQIQ